MSTEPVESSDDPVSRRVHQWKTKLDNLCDIKKLAEALYLDRDLTRSEFDEKVIDLGYRAALRVLAAEACAGDTKALDLFLKRCDLHFNQHRKTGPPDDSQAPPEYKPRPEK